MKKKQKRLKRTTKQNLHIKIQVHQLTLRLKIRRKDKDRKID